MSNQITAYTEELFRYRIDSMSKLPPGFEELASYTDELSNSRMRISKDVAGVIRLLCRLTDASKVLDIGTFTGCSALVAASAMTAGKVITVDIDDRHRSNFERILAQASLQGVVEFRKQPALEVLSELGSSERDFDLVFIDADKGNYQAYFDASLEILRPGGVVVADDTLWMGRIVDEECDDRQLEPLRKFNANMASDERVENVVLPIGNGLTIAVKLPQSG